MVAEVVPLSVSRPIPEVPSWKSCATRNRTFQAITLVDKTVNAGPPAIAEVGLLELMMAAAAPDWLIVTDAPATEAQRTRSGCQGRLMRLATNPAPKPLSMFTTVTLLEQLFSMPSKAASPWKLAP